jgi:type I restriction enzyme S subunit
MKEQASLGDISETSGNSEEQKSNEFQEVFLGPKKRKIPSEWRIVPMSKTGQLNPESFDVKDREEDKFDYIEISSVKEGRIQEKGEFSRNDVPSRAKRVVRENDLLVSKVRPYLRGFYKADPDDEENICSSGFSVIRTNGEFNSEFLHQYILSKPFNDQMVSLMTGSNYPSVTGGDFKNIKVVKPKKDEQRRIASVLYNVDQAIQKTEEIIEQTQRVKKGLMQDLFPKGIDNQEFSEERIFGKEEEIPKNYKIDDLSKIFADIIDYRGKNPDFSESGIPHLRNINIENNRIVDDELKYVSEETYDEWMTRGIPQEGDILFSTEAPMGKCALVPDYKFSISQRVVVLQPGDELLSEYAMYLMESPFMQNQYKAYATGSTVKGISNANLQKVKVLFPPKEEQRKIAGAIDSVIEKRIKLEDQKEQLQRLKKGLMQDFLTGSVSTGEDVSILDEVVEVENCE